MFRGILAVIAGYVVLVFIAIAGLTGLWLALGESFAFKEGTKEVTTAWIALDQPRCFVAPIHGGRVSSHGLRPSVPTSVKFNPIRLARPTPS